MRAPATDGSVWDAVTTGSYVVSGLSRTLSRVCPASGGPAVRTTLVDHGLVPDQRAFGIEPERRDAEIKIALVPRAPSPQPQGIVGHDELRRPVIAFTHHRIDPQQQAARPDHAKHQRATGIRGEAGANRRES